MYKTLRIIFCILAALLAAAAVFVFIYAGWKWGLMAVLAAFVCGALMVTFKQMQEREEKKANPPAPEGDFITGKVDQSDKNNAE